MKIERQSIKANFIYNMLFQILNILLPLITTPYIARVLGAENIGIYSYTYSIISTFVMVGSLGIGTYGQREIAAAGNDSSVISNTFWEIQFVKIISVSVTGLVYFVFSMIYHEYSLYFLIQLPYFFSAILDISWLYQGLENFKYVALRNIFVKIISLVLILFFVRTDSDLPIYLIILCGSQLLGNSIMWSKVPNLIGKPQVALNNLKRHIRPVLVYFIPTISYQIYAVLDKAMLGVIGSDISENGFYEQAHKLINMVIIIIQSYTVVMRSRMTVYFSQGNVEKIEKHLSESLHFIGLLVFPMTFGLAALAGNIVPWFFGDGYDKVTTLLIIFSPFFIIHSLGLCIGSHLLTPSGQQGKSNIGQCAAAVVNVILNGLMIPHLGSIGAAIASVCAECIIVIFYMYFVREYLSMLDVIRVFWKYCLCAVVMFIILRQIVPYLPYNIVGTTIGILFGGIIYFCGLGLIGDAFFKQRTKDMLQKIIFKVHRH